MKGRLLAALAVCAVVPAVHARDDGQFYVAAGRFSPANNAQLTNQRGHLGFALGGGGRFSPRVSWDIDFSYSHQGVDLPPAFNATPRADIETWGLGGIVKATLPLARFEPYVGAGAGLYRSTFTAHRPTSLTTNQDVRRIDEGPGLLFVAGMDLRFGTHWAIGFQWRRFDMEAQFDPEIPGKVKVGGNFGLLQLHRVF